MCAGHYSKFDPEKNDITKFEYQSDEEYGPLWWWAITVVLPSLTNMPSATKLPQPLSSGKLSQASCLHVAPNSQSDHVTLTANLKSWWNQKYLGEYIFSPSMFAWLDYLVALVPGV